MSPSSPRFSVVIAATNSESASEALLSALSGQTFPRERIEVVEVDSDSTEALNQGLASATGEWVTFPRQSDLLAEDYFAALDSFLTNHAEVDLACAQVVVRDGMKQKDARNSRSFMFDRGDRVVDLNLGEGEFPYSAHSAVFRREAVQRLGITFETSLRPNFADVKFTAEFVLKNQNSQVGFVQSAAYIESALEGAGAIRQSYIADPDYFTVVPRDGLLNLLTLAKDLVGGTPSWLGLLVLAELDWYFRSEELLNQDTAATGPVAEDFLETVQAIATHQDTEQLENYQPHRSQGPWPEFLLHGLKGDSWHLPYVIEVAHDEDRGAVKIVYNFSGALPVETFLVDGTEFQPLASKIRSYRYFERGVHFERIVWLPAGGPRKFMLNGTEVPLATAYLGPLGNLNPRATKNKKKKPKTKSNSSRANDNRVEQFKIDASGWKVWDRKFGDAWLICDRLHNASDNGEVLFKYLRKNRPDINAWFIITEGTPDHKRLRAEGYGKRLLTPGSFNWHAAMRRAKYLASSHAAGPIISPPQAEQHYNVKFKVVFLQHGVTMRDMSTWLNKRDFALFVAATRDEHESIVGDGTPYVFTDREVKLTGFPRFDDHLKVDQATPEGKKNLVLVAPTWRYWLTEPHDITGKESRKVSTDFFKSEYIQNWMEILNSEHLAKLANEQNLRLGFLPHPNLRTAQSLFNLPKHIELLSFEDLSPQQIFAQTKLMITDYSSIAFDLAYLGRPSIYFQFDHNRVAAGGHNGRPGYFKYETMGFGPVAYDQVAAQGLIVDALERGATVDERYLERINITFPPRDGKCTERVVAQIESLSD